MINREIYDAALALLAEEQDELSVDYEERAPHILSAFMCECRELDGAYRRIHGGEALPEEGASVDLDDEFPLSHRFFTAGVYYLAALLVENENDALCDRYFARYAAALKSITEASALGTSSSIRDVYGFHAV